VHVSHLVLIAVFVAAGTACIITSNVMFYRIFDDVNSKRPREQQFGFMFVNIRFFEIMGEHTRSFPESRKRSLMYLWAGSGFALFLTAFFCGLCPALTTQFLPYSFSSGR
jgi:hypothetical protein